jgi:uncharacterized phage-like protein YoqJ
MIIAGTGHRPQGLTDKKSVRYTNALVNALAEFYIPYLRKMMPERVIVGMALGTDTGLAVACARIGVPFWAAIPHYHQESKWGKAAQDLYDRLLLKAKETIFVEQGEYAAWKMQSRNEWMVNQADTVLALWNGSSGGTANCVAYANKVGKPVINLWDEWVKFRSQYSM